MTKPNYKALSFFRLREFAELTGDDYSFGDLLYSVFRKTQKPINSNTGWLRDVTDEDFYIAIEKAYKEEQTEQQETA